MIDHNNSFIVVRNPKAASTSLRVALMGECARVARDHDHLVNYHHYTPEFYPPEKFSTYVTAVSIREPIERAISFWRFFRRKGDYVEFDSILDWARAGCPAPSRHLNNERSAGCEVMDQHRYVKGVDFVIPVGRMLPIVNRIRKVSNLPSLDEMPRLNEYSGPAPGTPTPELRGLLEDRFHDDLILFEKWR